MVSSERDRSGAALRDPEPEGRGAARPAGGSRRPPTSEAEVVQDEVVQGRGSRTRRSRGPRLAHEEAESAPPEKTAKVAATPRQGRSGLWAWAVCAVAIVAVVLAFFSWRSADNDPDRARADLRDKAVIQGTEAVETMNSIDYRDVASGVEAWQDVSTGVLHDQAGRDDPGGPASCWPTRRRSPPGGSSRRRSAILTDRTATLLVAVEVTVRGEDGTVQPTVKRNRFAADLVLVKGTWKLENLAQVAVGT